MVHTCSIAFLHSCCIEIILIICLWFTLGVKRQIMWIGRNKYMLYGRECYFFFFFSFLFFNWDVNVTLYMFGFNLIIRLHFATFFFILHVNCKIMWFYCTGDKKYCFILFMSCLRTIYGSHNTIYIFKNYITTVFSVFNFQFQQK